MSSSAPAANAQMDVAFPCDDFQFFKAAVLKHRTFEDNIINVLNTTIPTKSLVRDEQEVTRNCKSLYEQLDAAHQVRERNIAVCIDASKNEVERLAALAAERGDAASPELLDDLAAERSKLRKFQSEVRFVASERTLHAR